MDENIAMNASCFVSRNLDMNGHRPMQEPVLQLLTHLGQAFSTLVDRTLSILVKVSCIYLTNVDCYRNVLEIDFNIHVHVPLIF